MAPPRLGEWGLFERKNELQQLREEVLRAGRGGIVTVAGLGGVGKTALVTGYLAEQASDYSLVAWIQAEDPELIPGQFQSLVLNRTGRELETAAAVAATKALLAETEDWILVFDNAASHITVEDYVPAGQGTVIVTTRNETWHGGGGRSLRLTALSTDSAVAWLIRALPGNDVGELRELASRLGGLPLAIVQAVSFIASRPGETVGTYLAKISTKSGQQAVYSQRRPAGYPLPVATTWRVAMDDLRESAPDAAGLLALLGYVGADSVPVEILVGLQEGEDVPGSLESLGHFGLVQCTTTEVGIHRLVQEISRWPLSSAEEAGCISRWSQHLAHIAPDHESHTSFRWFRTMAPHILSLIEHAVRIGHGDTHLGHMGYRLGISLNDQASHDAARRVLESSLRIQQWVHSSDLTPVASTLGVLGVAYRGLDMQPLAAETLQEGLAMLTSAVGTEHPDVARMRNNLGRAYVRLDRSADACLLHAQAAAYYAKAFGGEHREVAVSLTNLGVARIGTGDYDGSVEVLEDAVRIFTNRGGDDSPDAAWALGNLGLSHLEGGRFAEARAAYERALAIFEHSYGSDSRDAALSMVALGLAHAATGKSDGVVESQLRALKILIDIFGPRHSWVARALLQIAKTNEHLQDIENARRYYVRALDTFVASVGPDHRDTKAARRGLERLGAGRGEPS